MTLIKNVIMQCDVIRVIFAYQTKLNIKQSINYLCNAIKKTFGEISLHRHFKVALELQNEFLFF